MASTCEGRKMKSVLAGIVSVLIVLASVARGQDITYQLTNSQYQ
jgi:hypothetical protein